MRLRDKRERQALKFLASRDRHVSAAELGLAAVEGETNRTHVEMLTVLGMKIGNHFIRRGFARLDQFNRYAWVPK